MNEKNSRLVYSTDKGRVNKKDATPKPSTTTDGIVRITRETKGRKGKGVSLITGVPSGKLKETAKLLKQKLGVGGSVKQDVIEIQTDDRDKIKSLLETLKYQCKIAGG